MRLTVIQTQVFERKKSVGERNEFEKIAIRESSPNAFAIDDSASALEMPVGSSLEFTKDVVISPLQAADAAWTTDKLSTNGNKSSDQSCWINTARSIQVAGKTLVIQAGSAKSITRVKAERLANVVVFFLNAAETISLTCGRNVPHRRNSKIHITIHEVKSLLKDAGIILDTEMKQGTNTVAI